MYWLKLLTGLDLHNDRLLHYDIKAIATVQLDARLLNASSWQRHSS